MAQYIDKDALVAEIKRILLIYTKHYDELAKYEVWGTANEIEYRIQGLKEALSILDTLEVKEVDIDWKTKYKKALKICEYHLVQGDITFLVASDMFREMWENKLDAPYYKYYRKEINK